MKSFIATGLSAALLITAFSFAGVTSAAAAERPAGPAASSATADISITLPPGSPTAQTETEVSITHDITPNATHDITPDATRGLLSGTLADVRADAPFADSATTASVRLPYFAIAPNPVSALPGGAVANACILTTCGENTATAVASGLCWAVNACGEAGQVDACILANCEQSPAASCSVERPCVTACVIASCSAAESTLTPTDPSNPTTPGDTSDSDQTALAGILGSTGGNGALAFTGANAIPQLAAGLIVLLLGGVLVLAARSRIALQH